MSRTPPPLNRKKCRHFTPEQITALRVRVQSSPRLQRLAAAVTKSLARRELHMLRSARRTGALEQTPGLSGDGHEIEFGHVAHWLNYPADDSMRSVADAWRNIAGELPPTAINPVTFSMMAQQADIVLAVADDGSIYGTGTYELLDPSGLSIFAEYIWHYFMEDFASFTIKSVVVPIYGNANQTVRVALVGDWGTGPYSPAGPAADVMSQIQRLNPDYVIHLGDTYYSGTSNEEKNNLLADWGGVTNKSFTLNSNHEMYDGGYGYFQTALAHPLFGAQQGASYFALQYGDASHGGPWTLLALDTGYWSTSPLVMNGSICDPISSRSGATAQPDFISELRLSPENVILLTHHNPITYDGTSVIDDGTGNALWSQITASLGEPAAWYWGHVHNAVVYTMPTVASKVTLSRCLGHGAIPFGPASGLAAAQNPTPPQPKRVEWYANTPNPCPAAAPRVLNGFVLLTLTLSGEVTEVFYDQTGTVAYKPSAPYQLGRGIAKRTTR